MVERTASLTTRCVTDNPIRWCVRNVRLPSTSSNNRVEGSIHQPMQETFRSWYHIDGHLNRPHQMLRTWLSSGVTLSTDSWDAANLMVPRKAGRATRLGCAPSDPGGQLVCSHGWPLICSPLYKYFPYLDIRHQELDRVGASAADFPRFTYNSSDEKSYRANFGR